VQSQQLTLEGWLKFNDDDVSSNRDGLLSSRQRGRLIWSGLWRMIVGPPALAGGVMVALLLDTALLAALALIAAAIGLYIAWRGFAFLVDALAGDVAFVTSRLHLAVVHGKTTSYYAHIGPVSKNISSKAYRALPDGAELHLYYAPGCRSLLSLESSSETDPRPTHPFGPDSAHAWDRLRWSWVLMTMGVLGLAIGAHQLAAAHPAHPYAVEGVMTNYVETHGKSTSRTIYMDDGHTYTPKSEASYDPPVTSWPSLVGQPVTLYVDAGTTNVLAVNIQGRLYAADWYEHPDHETSFDIVNGVITTGLAALIGAIGVLLLLRDRRRAESPAGTDQLARAGRMTPPSVRSPASLTSTAIAFGILLVVLGGFFGLVFAGIK
jgi:hypothetical protein